MTKELKNSQLAVTHSLTAESMIISCQIESFFAFRAKRASFVRLLALHISSRAVLAERQVSSFVGVEIFDTIALNDGAADVGTR